MTKVLINNLIEQMRSLVFEENWLETSFAEKIDALSEEQAFAQPIAEVHTVAELLSHLTRWKAEVLHRISGGQANLTMMHPDNWKTNAELRMEGWCNVKQEFYAVHRSLTTFLEKQNDAFLHRQFGPYRYGEMLNGLIHHDVYHLGQLGITIKLVS